MNKTDKRTALVIGTVIVAVLLLLLFRGRAGGATLGANDWQMPGVAAGSLGDIVVQGSGPIVIPGLDLGGRDLQMIGSCCMDCSSANSGSYSRPAGTTFVYNAGARGNNVYNYTTVTQTAPQDSGGFLGIPWVG